jgi:hypothetical protein
VRARDGRVSARRPANQSPRIMGVLRRFATAASLAARIPFSRQPFGRFEWALGDSAILCPLALFIAERQGNCRDKTDQFPEAIMP